MQGILSVSAPARAGTAATRDTAETYCRRVVSKVSLGLGLCTNTSTNVDADGRNTTIARNKVLARATCRAEERTTHLGKALVKLLLPHAGSCTRHLLAGRADAQSIVDQRKQGTEEEAESQNPDNDLLAR